MPLRQVLTRMYHKYASIRHLLTSSSTLMRFLTWQMCVYSFVFVTKLRLALQLLCSSISLSKTNHGLVSSQTSPSLLPRCLRSDHSSARSSAVFLRNLLVIRSIHRTPTPAQLSAVQIKVPLLKTRSNIM